jgi:hypothetical protein
MQPSESNRDIAEMMPITVKVGKKQRRDIIQKDKRRKTTFDYI